ncbi:helix-turn-helix domain-containing protein [Bacillus sp. Marseille-P3661]|uniref:helix-turn-helix domain-containing protein n=1 Tax=Bacillus sp. Marseille-P3661 TaxID=1936234 RepID=UPI000C81FFA9|nr:GAF domain-containing protein [Bacillus sp. Marseille-P3661]
MKETALASIATKFNQDGISIWLNEDETISCISEWNGCPDIYQDVVHFFQKDKKELQLENSHLFKVHDFVIALHGKTKINRYETFHYLNEWYPWINTLVELEKNIQREKSLHLLMDVAHTIASSLQNEDILKIIIESAVKTIPNADTGFLFLYDKKINKLLVKSAVGFKEESYKRTRLVPGEGVTGKVFSSRKSIMINDKKKISDEMANMSSQNFSHYINSTMLGEFPNSMMSAPLIFKEEVIGVLTIDSFTKQAKFTNEDLQILEALADHVAVAIMQSELFQKERKYREELQLTHVALRHEHEQLQRTTDLHNRLTNIAAQGEGIEAIVKTLDAMVEVPFAIYDSLLKPLYVSDQVEQKRRRPPTNFFKHPAIKKLLSTKKWQKIDLTEKEMLIVFPIVGAETILGFLLIWTDSEELLGSNSVLFEYGATVLALEWTKQEAIREVQERIKGEFFEEVLSGHTNVQLYEQAKNLGLKPDDYYTVILCQRKSGGRGASHTPYIVGMERQRWVDHLENILTEHSLPGLVFQRGSMVVGIVSFSAKKPKSDARKIIKDLLPKLEKLPEKVQIGIGRVHKGLLNFKKSYTDAEQCLKVLDSTRDRGVLSYAEMGVYRFFLQHDREELRFFLMDILGPLINYDQRKKSTLLETLIMYVKFDKEINKLTAELNIHYNTLYYRINRIQEILAVSFDNHDDWFNIQLACQVYEYLEGSTENK